MKRYIMILTVVLAASLRLSAWGGLEHTVIAYIAQEHLTENTLKNLRYYLDQPIYEYSEWMDFKPVVRHSPFKITRTGHSTAVGRDCTIPEITPFEGGEGKGSCYKYLKEINHTLKNHRSMADSLVIFHLRCFLHMIGDFHCPVHVNFFDLPADGGSLPAEMYTSGEGFTDIYYKEKKTTLHSIWDSSLRNIHSDWTPEQWRLELDTWSAEQIEEAVDGDFKTYLEGCIEVTRAVYGECVPGMKLDDDYFTVRKKNIVYRQILLSSYRMAKILNDCFDYEE